MADAIKHQFWLLAEVRWDIMRNSLRLKGKKLELAAQILAIALGALIALALGTGLGGVAYVLLVKGKNQIVPALLEGIFFAWLLGPVLLEGSSPTLDFRTIARYPVSFRLYYLLNLAYGLLDPWALLCLVWLASVWLGLAFARPQWAVAAALWFGAFAALNLLLNRVVFGALERVMRSRRGRESLLAALMGLAACMTIVIYGVLPRWGESVIHILAPVFSFTHQALPAGFVSRALLSDRWTDSLITICAFLGYALLAALVLWRQSWRNYQGEISSEAPPARAAAQMQPGWKLPWLDEATSAIIEKELRYARGDSRVWMMCLSGPFMAFVIAASSNVLRGTGIAQKISQGTIYAALAGFLIIGFAQHVYNSFSYDGHGFQCWLMSPVEFRRVMVGKNVALFTLMAGSYSVATALLAAKGGISFMQILTVTGACVFGATAMFAAGNIFSVRFPTRVEFGRLSSGKPSPVAVLLGLVIQVCIVGALWLLFYLTHRWKMDLLPLFALPVMILSALRGYLFSLRASAKYVQFHAEDIYAALT